MRKIRRTWKAYAIIIIFCAILILQKNNLIYYIANMPKGDADNVWEWNYTYEASPYLEDFFGSEMTKYCTKDMKDLYYCLFDMTDDGITDLCISDEREFIYVISYDEEKKRLTLWNGFDST